MPKNATIGDRRYKSRMLANERILGVEGGGTKTAWALVIDGKILESGRLPPSNFRLTPSDQLTKILRVMPGEVDRVGIFLAGCGTEEDRTRLIKLAREVWPKARIVGGSDRDAGVAACLRERKNRLVKQSFFKGAPSSRTAAWVP